MTTPTNHDKQENINSMASIQSEWRPSEAKSRLSGSSTDTATPEPLETDICCGTGEGIASEDEGVAILDSVDLVRDLEHVAHRLCNEQSDRIIDLVVLREHVVWEKGPPKSSSGPGIFHTSAVTPSHLALMRQRNCGDYIEADFGTHYDDEEFRHERMLRALTKLSKRASSHCNR
ncbi:hypothetical protein F4860DRAFT_510300 [Xylaria cubensis]|nr:hypothetical protein F4860DRAFT_510300 [Xylaria cubensis]